MVSFLEEKTQSCLQDDSTFWLQYVSLEVKRWRELGTFRIAYQIYLKHIQCDFDKVAVHSTEITASHFNDTDSGFFGNEFYVFDLSSAVNVGPMKNSQSEQVNWFSVVHFQPAERLVQLSAEDLIEFCKF